MRSANTEFLFAIGITAVAILLGVATASSADEADAVLIAADKQIRAGDLDGALERLEPLLDADSVDQQTKQRAGELAAGALYARGAEHFRQAQIAEAIADFDRQLQLQPGQAPEHWQRGIAYYYAGEYEKGARQFELHQTVNAQDVENAAWHFLCAVRTAEGSVEAARKKLIAVTEDARVPMVQIQQMFAGTMSPEDVLQAGENKGATAQFYADLYVGLYYEALGQDDESLRLITRAAENPAAKDNYMGDVARVHVALRKQSAFSPQVRGRLVANEKKRKVLLLAGEPSHSYGAHDHLAGCRLLAKSLNNAGLPVEAEIYHYGWPQDAKLFEGIDCLVMYADGGEGHMANAHLEEIDALAKKGVGIVCLHYAVEVPKGPSGQKFLEWIGGYFETDWSVNPHWTAKFAKLPEHPITRGVRPFELNDEWYYHMRFRDGMRGVTPILTAMPPADSLSRPDGSHSGNPHVRAAIARGEPQHVAWAATREDGGRGFGFTGAHVHWNWADPDFRKLVLNAIAWCANVEVPAKGVSDEPKTLAEMESNHDEEVPADFDREEIRKRYDLPPDGAGSAK